MTLLVSAAAHADIYGGLGPDDQATLNSGGQVVPDPQDVDGSAWPRVVVYQRVEATPDQVAAIMFDYALHKTMFAPQRGDDGSVSSAGITQSDPKTVATAGTDIDYTMVFPKVLGIALPDEHYTVHDVLSTFEDGGYQINWTFVKASSMKDTGGGVQFERLGTGTLIAYTQFISPPRPTLARLIKSMYIKQVKDTVTALANQAVGERTGATPQLNTQLANLKKALGQ